MKLNTNVKEIYFWTKYAERFDNKDVYLTLLTTGGVLTKFKKSPEPSKAAKCCKKGNKLIIMKKIFLGLIPMVLLFFFSCVRNENQDENVNENKLFETVEKGKYNKISRSLFIYGVNSYTISENEITFDTYRDFNVNNRQGNFSKYKFKINNNYLTFNSKSIGIEKNKLLIKNNSSNTIINKDTNFNNLDFESKILLIIFSEIFGNDNNKKYFEDYVLEFENASNKGGCSWSNTYYISGWGKTPAAAWSDYHSNSASLNGLPNGTTCSPIGYPHLSTMTVSLVIAEFDLYQVDRAYCCT